MDERRSIFIPEITRVEGHAAVDVDIRDGKVCNVHLNVFEGTRFFERIVLGHKYSEIAHITSRVCAICSTGHVLAAIFAMERIFGYQPGDREMLFRELMHLGMIIESHATHVFALALPDFLNVPDLVEFATSQPEHFQNWMKLRGLGAAVQTCVGGRPFHPVNLHVGGLSKYPGVDSLAPLVDSLQAGLPLAQEICALLLGLKPAVQRTTEPEFLALRPYTAGYGFFGDQIVSTAGWTRAASEYPDYLREVVAVNTHSKRALGGSKPMMVGAMARLALFGDRLGSSAGQLFAQSTLSRGDTNTVLNNLAQAIEIVEAIERALEIVQLLVSGAVGEPQPLTVNAVAGSATGAVECPRGTLYHSYSLDADGCVTAADLVTPSVQNTARIELDIREVVDNSPQLDSSELQAQLETLIRAYDPCNTCATHMVSVRYEGPIDD